MKLSNNMEINIYKGHYSKAEKVEGTENTYRVNGEKTYPLYEFELHKVYRDINSKEECLNEVILDLKNALRELKQIRNRGEMGGEMER